MKLIVLESPSKIKTISKFIDSKYKVVSTKGHIVEISNKHKYNLGYDFDNHKIQYKILEDKEKIISELKKEFKANKEIYIATDPDREGEAIAFHINNLIKESNKDAKVKRITFNEITKKSVLSALSNPREIDFNLVSAQETRVMVDRIVGFRLSSLSRAKLSSKSVGRVQTAVLGLIYDRHKEITNFVSEKWFEIHFEYKVFEKPLKHIDLKSKKISKFDNLENAKKHIVHLTNTFKLEGRKDSISIINKPLPFETYSVLAAASSKLGFSNIKTSFSLQKLYENGLITYPRTDSNIISSEDFLKSAKNYINNIEANLFEYDPTKRVKKINKNEQGAHEAIRVTNLTENIEKVSGLTEQDKRLYKLIKNRILKALSKNSINEIIALTYKNNENLFRTTMVRTKYLGFRIHDKDYLNDVKENSEVKILDKIVIENANALDPIQFETQPKSQYSSAKIISAMKEVGIGRPSTYTYITSILLKRNYVETSNKSLIITKLGQILIENLSKYFDDLINVEYTSKIENDLDKIATGNINKEEYILNFFNKLEPRVQEALNKLEKVDYFEELEEYCPLCADALIEKIGRYGKYTLCKRYKDGCPYKQPKKVIRINYTCPDCKKSLLLVRKNKKNQNFISCSSFPNCRFVDKFDSKKYII